MAYPKLVLHHYTSGSGIAGIFDSKQIWATNIHCLNDAKEFVHAISLAKSAVRQSLEEQMGGEGDSVYAAIERSLNSLSRLSVYVSCFSEVEDSLSQWRGYCPPGFGYSIGFDGEHLKREARRQGFNLGKCIYDAETQKAITLAWARETVEMVISGLRESDDIAGVVQDSSAYFLSKFYDFAPLLKHHSFHSESEWRLYGLVGGDDPRMRIRAGKSMLIRYVSVDLGFGKESQIIWNMLVGPTPHAELAGEALTIYFNKFLIRNGIGYSQSPYRDW